MKVALRVVVVLLTAALAPALAPASAPAQVANRTHFNIAAGAAIPTSDFGNAVDVGFNLTAGFDIAQRGSPLGLRFEGMFDQFNVSNQHSFTFNNVTNQIRVWGAAANGIYDIPLSAVAAGNTLYAIGGVGFANTSATLDQGSGQTNLAWNVGGGFRFPLTGFSAYVEARYYSINSTSVTFAPIAFGLVF